MQFHPYGLVLFEGSMYLIGYFVQATAFRTLKVKRIEKVEITKRHFKKPEDFSLERCLSRSYGIIYKEIKPITIRYEFRSWAAKLIREQKWHRTQVIEEDTGDKLVASFLLDTTSEFKPFMCIWLWFIQTGKNLPKFQLWLKSPNKLNAVFPSFVCGFISSKHFVGLVYVPIADERLNDKVCLWTVLLKFD